MKYYIITYGCQMNKSDSERLTSRMEKKKYQPVSKIEKADLVIINVCSVRQSAIDRVYSKIRQLRQKYSKIKIILTGCILEKDKRQFQEQVDEILPLADLEIKAKRQSICQAYVPIMTGCNNFCSYCAVPFTRGREKSRPAEKIIKEIKGLVKKGYQEIILLGQNVNSYHNTSLRGGRLWRPTKQSHTIIEKPRDCFGLRPHNGINFATLLQLINDLPDNFQIKFLTSHPKDMSDELIKVIAQGKKISKQIHLPVQSGDNQILKKMNRGYTVSQYKKLIKKIQRAIPQVKISTDIIVGFPSETKKQFQNTVKLVKQIGFSQIYAAAYSPRAGSTAAKLKDNVPAGEKKRRKKIILAMVGK